MRMVQWIPRDHVHESLHECVGRYVWLTHEFWAAYDTFDKQLIDPLTGCIRTIKKNQYARLDKRARGSARTSCKSEENEIGGIYLMRHFLLILTTLVITLLPGHLAFAQGTTDLRAFEKRCTACHGNPSVAQAPDGLALRRLTPEAVYAAITTGATHAK